MWLIDSITVVFSDLQINCVSIPPLSPLILTSRRIYRTWSKRTNQSLNITITRWDDKVCFISFICLTQCDYQSVSLFTSRDILYTQRSRLFFFGAKSCFNWSKSSGIKAQLHSYHEWPQGQTCSDVWKKTPCRRAHNQCRKHPYDYCKCVVEPRWDMRKELKSLIVGPFVSSDRRDGTGYHNRRWSVVVDASCAHLSLK